jgi:hypothetical protein
VIDLAVWVVKEVVKTHLGAWKNYVELGSMAIRLDHLYEMVWLTIRNSFNVCQILFFQPKWFFATVTKLFSRKFDRPSALYMQSIWIQNRLRVDSVTDIERFVEYFGHLEFAVELRNLKLVENSKMPLSLPTTLTYLANYFFASKW